MRLIIGALFFGTIFFSHSLKAGETPKFIAMTGYWQSKAINASSKEVMTSDPEFSAIHHIYASPFKNPIGINFVVCTKGEGGYSRVDLTYTFTESKKTSIGTITPTGGSPMKGIISHGATSDELNIYAVDGTKVWTEKNTWISDDEFTSLATFEFEGKAASANYITKRMPLTIDGPRC